MTKHYIETAEDQNQIASKIRNMSIPEHGVLVEIKFGQRTLPQNNAMYKYFAMLTEALNNSGLEIHMEFLGKTCDVPWTPEAVKERLWDPIMFALTEKRSTAKLERDEVSKIYDVLHRHLAERHGVNVMFPSKDR